MPNLASPVVAQNKFLKSYRQLPPQLQTMSLAIVAKVAHNGITVVDSQTVLVNIASGGMITLNFGSTDQMMSAAEAMAFGATVVTPLVVLVPETPKNGEEVIDIVDTPTAAPKEQNNNSTDLDSSGVSRDMLGSSLDEDDDVDDKEEEEDRFDEDLAEGVRRIKINANQDDSFEDTIGLTQEMW
jgi:hypothetical protein